MKILLGLLASCFSLTLHAAGDLALGKEKAAVCIACHGTNGVSINKDWPNLAGQHASYLVKQLKDFKAGTERNNPVMTGIIANLNENDFADIAAFYASLPIPTAPASSIKLQKLGESLYRNGDFKRHVAACIACHGPDGQGNAQAGFPSLVGQNASYLVLQMQAFKSGQRHNDLNGIMRTTSSKMTEEEMQAVAEYLGTIK